MMGGASLLSVHSKTRYYLLYKTTQRNVMNEFSITLVDYFTLLHSIALIMSASMEVK